MRGLCGLLLVALTGLSAPAHAKGPSTGFYYGPWGDSTAPTELPKLFGRVVVEPSAVPDLAALSGTQAVAYLSVGERVPGAVPMEERGWVLGTNKAWGSTVMNVADPGYRQHLLARFEALIDAGYAGVFLDTLDSYQLVAKDDAQRALMQAGLVALISDMAKARPKAALLINRGFELLEQVAPYVDAIVAESLFDRFEPGRGYSRVPATDRKWLIAQLRRAQKLGLQVIVIDYRPPHEKSAARKTATRIAALGFTPYVVDGKLLSVGVSTFTVAPRRILLLDDGEAGQLPRESQAFKRLAPVLEYLGFVVDYHSVHEPLPQRPLAGSYHGIVTAFDAHPHRAGLGPFLRFQSASGVPLVLFGHPGFSLDSPIAEFLGLRSESRFRAKKGPVAIAYRDASVGFEAEPSPRRFSAVGLQIRGVHKAHLTLEDRASVRSVAVATTGFGGLARSHYWAPQGMNGEMAWVIDPFAFLSTALRIDDQRPVPDVTTVQGLRTAMAVVRSEGASLPSRLPGQALHARVLNGLLHEIPLAHDLDLTSSPLRGGTPGDAAAARALLASSWFEAGTLPTGTTRAEGQRGLLSALEPIAYPEGGELTIPVPVAPDLAFIGHSVESYPYNKVRETWAFLGSPRRLRPVALDYHAYVAGSPSGLSMLRSLYDALLAEPVYSQHLADYARAVTGFVTVAMAETLEGEWRFGGLSGPLTLRLGPGQTGIDLQRSQGVLTYGASAASHYVSLADGANARLVLRSTHAAEPHLTFSSGPLRAVELRREGGGVVGHIVLQGRGRAVIGGAGFPPRGLCSGHLGQSPLNAQVDASGGLLLTLPAESGVDVALRCSEASP